MRYTIGRLLQALALFLLPLAMLWQIGGFLAFRIGVDAMLLMMLGGVALFLIGKLIQGPPPPGV